MTALGLRQMLPFAPAAAEIGRPLSTSTAHLGAPAREEDPGDGFAAQNRSGDRPFPVR
jgi:hypothetical protein